MRLLRPVSLLLAGLLVASATAPTVAAQGHVEPICQILCLVIIVIATMVGQCANGEVQQTVYGIGEGCVYTNALQDGLGCAVAYAQSLAGLSDPCPA